MNPLDLKGPEFLGLYACLFVGVLLAALWLRRSLRSNGAEPPPEGVNLAPYEVAYLAGGERLVVNAALANLVQQNALAVRPTERRVTVIAPPRDDAPTVEKAVYARCGATSDQGLKRLHASVPASATRVGDRLRELGLVLRAEETVKVRLGPCLLFVALVLFGVMKIMVGIDRGKPVGILAVAVALTAVTAVVFLVKRPHRSRAGDRVLEQLKAERAALQTTARARPDALSGNDLVLALGLFGLGVLATGMLADLRTALRPANASGGCSTGGCGSGCGGGGGGGCGGGGCGGCGGGGD
jgi:uncharacterized protein (TIGR04222 family)